MLNKINYLIKSLFLLFTLSSSTITFAYGSGETPISEGLSYIISAMLGATGITIATLSVMMVGLLCLGHFLKWNVLLYTIVGIGMIFGSGTIVHAIISLVH